MSEPTKLSIKELAAAYEVAMDKVAATSERVRSAERDLRRAEREENEARANAATVYASLQEAVAAQAEEHQ